MIILISILKAILHNDCTGSKINLSQTKKNVDNKSVVLNFCFFFRDILRNDLIFIKTTNERCYLEWKIFPKIYGWSTIFFTHKICDTFWSSFFYSIEICANYLSIYTFFLANDNASMYPIHSFIHLVSQWIYDIHSYKMPKKTTKIP